MYEVRRSTTTSVTCYYWGCSLALWQRVPFYQPIGSWFWNCPRIMCGRNKFTENSGRLHPLWPQNKWLHTPRTTDYRHTRQDGWIQTELAFTLAKNATKPNPFEIIPLQATRKENNWKTEEALARAAVNLETERIKGSNPWCLWRWWWRYYRFLIYIHICEANILLSIFVAHSRKNVIYAD